MAAVLLSISLSLGLAAGLGPRTGNNTLNMPANATLYPYTTVNALGDLSFSYPVNVVAAPGDSTRVFVVEQGGSIWAVNLNTMTRSVFLDISDRISYGRPEDEGGTLGLAFHPNYSANGYMFVYYLCNTATSDGNGRHNRLSRFTRSRNDPLKADASSEVILFSQYDELFNHNGGTVLFGPDGYLYITLGDEGYPNDVFENGQRIDKDFFAGVFRIDVDHKPGSLPPNPHPSLGGRVNYWVPPDNPYVGATSFNGRAVDPTRVRTEFYAVGLRSPWRMFQDAPTGNLYVSDVGEIGLPSGHSEEINLIVRGGNYGWPYREADAAGPKADETPGGFSSLPPLLTYARGESGPMVGRAAIGGVVYRGANFPELSGAYIFGDYYSGNVWKLRHSGYAVQEWAQLTAFPNGHLVSFGTDPRNGDVLICDIHDGMVKRLVPTPASALPPQTLAETGAFSDLQLLTPYSGIVPYDINVPFWSDGADKQRWFSIPDASAKIRPQPNGQWDFPEGTVFIKHFELEMVSGDPVSRRRIETRFLVRNSEGVYGVTYRWNDAQNNATLVDAPGDNQTFTVIDNGVARQQTWHFPSRNECLTCHNSVAGHVLGMNGAQMNRTFNYGTFTAQQIKALSQAGYFSGHAATGRKLVSPASQTASLDSRVRSYLAANCSQCHQPGGFGRSPWDARITTPTARAGIINGVLNDTMGDPAHRVVAPKSLDHSMILQRLLTLDPRYRMPPLGSSVIDTEAVNLMTQWINSLKKRAMPLRVRITAPRTATTREQIVTIRGTASGDNLAGVVYSVNDGPEQTASGITTWSAEVTLEPGVNRITVYAADNTANRSRPLRKVLRFAP
ncbi:MAG TPA: PQQ-dependent sugar dehydrogenase [Methylomirabilota bacterium]|nr:PQQ-dependent sugar dehydrogenase [Methylomirabilota bacterium]